MNITIHGISQIDIESKRSQIIEGEPYDVFHINITDIDGKTKEITCFGDFKKSMGISFVDKRNEEPT